MTERREPKLPARAEIAPARYNQLAALIVTGKVINEYAGDFQDPTYSTALTDAVTAAIETKMPNIEPSKLLRTKATTEIEESLMDKVLTAEQYRTAAKTLKMLTKGDDDLKKLELDQVYVYMKNRAEDADYVKSMTKRAGDNLNSQQITTHLIKRERRLSLGVALTNTLSTVSLLAAIGGGGVTLYEFGQLNKLPTYASSSVRSQDLSEINTAVGDLKIKPAGPREEMVKGKPRTEYRPEALPDNGDAWVLLGGVEHDLRGAPTNVTNPLFTVRKDLAHPSLDQRVKDLFKRDGVILAQELDKIRRLGSTPVAIKYGHDVFDRDLAIGEGIGTFLLSGTVGEKNRRFRKSRKKLRKHLRR